MNRKDIEERASRILQDHGLLRVPVDPLSVTKALGIRVMSVVFSEPSKSGAIVKRGNEFSIFVNVNEAAQRKRFTIAHEVGHKLLHMDTGTASEFVDSSDNFRSIGISLDEGWTDERRKEWEANVFASALLMDERLLRAKWSESQDPEVLAWMFQVSSPAMLVRLTQLGLLQELT